MLGRLLKALRLLIIGADIVLITALIDPSLVPIVAATLTAFGTYWAVEPMAPEPAYDYPVWAYKVMLALSARRRKGTRPRRRAAH